MDCPFLAWPAGLAIGTLLGFADFLGGEACPARSPSAFAGVTLGGMGGGGGNASESDPSCPSIKKTKQEFPKQTKTTTKKY